MNYKKYILSLLIITCSISASEKSYFVDPRELEKVLKQISKDINKLSEEKDATDKIDIAQLNTIIAQFTSTQTKTQSYQLSTKFIKDLVKETALSDDKIKQEYQKLLAKQCTALLNKDNEEFKEIEGDIKDLFKNHLNKPLAHYSAILMKDLTVKDYIEYEKIIIDRITNIDHKLRVLNATIKQ